MSLNPTWSFFRVLSIFFNIVISKIVSGTTALGGMHLLAHSTSWSASLLGAAATTLSTVNIVGTCVYVCVFVCLRVRATITIYPIYQIVELHQAIGMLHITSISHSSNLCTINTHSIYRWIHCHTKDVGHVQTTG
jgi:hypothetical protein